VLVDTFKASLDPSLFKLYRRYLYSRYKATDELAQGEVIHEIAKDRLMKLAEKFAKNAPYFDPGEQLRVSVNGVELKSPVGVAAGFDKNCDMLLPLSHVFGYMNPGSVLLRPRPGNPQKPRSEGTVRMAIDDEREAIINAQGYPHKGLDHTIQNLRKFSQAPRRGEARILLNFSGITDEYTEDAVLDACREIIVRTSPYVDLGFEENRTSPNTDFNKVLQSPDFTKKMIDLMKTHIPAKLKASKIAPYSELPPKDHEKETRMKSIKVFYENGGQAVVIGNTRPVNTSSNPLTKNFIRPIAGESGRPLFPYMLKMVEDVHRAFPGLIIIACGGIWNGDDAWQAYQKGATLVQLYTALTFQGFGIVREIHDTLRKKLAGETLRGFIAKRDQP
jgi:dihydroorotate dehydrogenase